MNKEQEKQINELLEWDEGLTDWEFDFINSIAEIEGELSPRRAAKLDEIYLAYRRRVGQD